MTSGELVLSFADMARQQEDASFAGESARYNKLFDRIANIEAELRNRSGDERRLLCALYKDNNTYVRLQAAFATLAVEPELSRQVLQEIASAEDYPATAEARLMLRDLETGDFVPE